MPSQIKSGVVREWVRPRLGVMGLLTKGGVRSGVVRFVRSKVDRPLCVLASEEVWALATIRWRVLYDLRWIAPLCVLVAVSRV